jgi:hypothetical protein
LFFAIAFFLQSQHISGCSHTLTYFAITRIFTRLHFCNRSTSVVATTL